MNKAKVRMSYKSEIINMTALRCSCQLQHFCYSANKRFTGTVIIQCAVVEKCNAAGHMLEQLQILLKHADGFSIAVLLSA